MARREVPLTEHGVVDPAHLAPYLPPNPHEVPLDSARGTFEYHHVLFTAADHYIGTKDRTPEQEIICALRSDPYNQVNMTLAEEARYHEEHAEHVPITSVEVAVQFLREAKIISRLAAATMGMRDRNLAGHLFRTKDGRTLRDMKLDFLATKRNQLTSDLSSITVVPPVTAASAIARFAQQLRSPYLEKIAKEQIDELGAFVPVRTLSPSTLRVISNRMFARHLIEEPEDTNTFILPSSAELALT